MHRPLEGIRVIELGQLIAGPFAGCMLGYFGAEVIKIEPPGKGDALRGWRVVEDGTSLWWRSLGRNKKSLTLDLKLPEGRDLARQLIDGADVLIENFRPGVMEDWGLGPEAFKASNPGLVYTRISGFGQTGPYAQKPGFASVCEGMSGFRYVNGHPGQAPVRPNLSIGDTDGAGLVREPSGTTVTGIVPTNTYRCRDGKYVVIGGNGDSIFRRLMETAGRPDMAQDPRMASNAGRVECVEEIDRALADWCQSLDSADLLARLEAARVPSGPIYSVADMMRDPQFQARGLFEQVEINGKPLKIPAILPRLADTPGRTDWPGSEVGSHTEAVLSDALGLSSEQVQALRDKGIV